MQLNTTQFGNAYSFRPLLNTPAASQALAWGPTAGHQPTDEVVLGGTCQPNNPYGSFSSSTVKSQVGTWTKGGDNSSATLSGLMAQQGYSHKDLYQDGKPTPLLEAVMATNNLRNPNMIPAGGSLVLPGPRTTQESSSSTSGPEESSSSTSGPEDQNSVSGLRLGPSSGIRFRDRIAAAQSPSENVLDIREGGFAKFQHHAETYLTRAENKLRRRFGLESEQKPLAGFEHLVPTDEQLQRIVQSKSSATV